MRKLHFLVALSTTAVLGLANYSQAALSGTYSNQGATSISTVAQAVSLIKPVPDVTFTSNNVNGINYTGNDGTFVSNVLGTDVATATGITAQQFESGVLNETGTFVAPKLGVYTFSSNLDDGGAFFVDGNGTPGSGTEVAVDNGQHGQQLVTDTLTLSAGIHNVEYVYYNSECCNVVNDGTNNNGGGGIADSGVTIIDPNSVPVVTSPTPEPAVGGIALLGGIVLTQLRRRRSV